MNILKQHERARLGTLETPHGRIQTPCFMPIATKGVVKTLSAGDLKNLGAEIVLANTYHLLLRPGLQAMRQLGGLHRFMNWDRPILTDSGGYQVFSLSKINKIAEDGVMFQSHIDGSQFLLTPEISIQMQCAIQSDIMMQLDDVAAGSSNLERYEKAMERSLRWARRCKDEYSSLRAKRTNDEAMLFGIVQGGIHEDLRERSAHGLMDIGFDGYAIGGLSVGEKREDAYRIVRHVSEILPEDKPRYFMGAGMPEEIVAYVQMGIDMFDCVLPTRNARHGTLFVWNQDPALIDWNAYHDPAPASLFYHRLHITNERYELDSSSIDSFCHCETCQTTSRAYLRHLFRVQELLAYRLATIHNLMFYLMLMKSLRQCIVESATSSTLC